MKENKENKAIKILQRDLQIQLENKALPDGIEAIQIAIEALEKQIPKKPEYEGDGYADGELVYDYAKCPICGHGFEYGINDWGCEYCSDCGQKLDWSDEE